MGEPNLGEPNRGLSPHSEPSSEDPADGNPQTGAFRSRPARFILIGGAGFRAQFFLRVAAALPDRFAVSGLVIRDPEKRAEMERQWGVQAYATLEELIQVPRLAEESDFAVVSVSKGAGAAYVLRLAELGLPVLLETPPAAELADMLELYKQCAAAGARVQVAEQYHCQPLHAARLALVRSGAIGTPTQAKVSISQTYHAVSLMRKYLLLGAENAAIRGQRFHSPIVAGPGRGGPPTEERMITEIRDFAWLDFGGKLGIYDFAKDQHRSWIRSNHLSVRGDRGEIFDHRLNQLEDYATPLHLELKRINRGEEENLEGQYLEGLVAGGQWAYRNPYRPARLYDDEIAVAAILDKMMAYSAGGRSFYSLAEASQDHYLGLLIGQAIASGETVVSERQIWADELEEVVDR